MPHGGQGRFDIKLDVELRAQITLSLWRASVTAAVPIRASAPQAATTMDQDSYSNAYYRGHVVPSAATSLEPTPLRSGTPNTEGSRNAFDNDTASSRQLGRTANPFGSPNESRPPSSYGSSSAVGPRNDASAQRYFHSRRIKKGEVEKPWLQKRDPKEKWVTILPIAGILIGLGLSGFLVWDGVRNVVHHKYCSVMDDDFSSGFDTNIWTKEVQMGGFG